MDTHPLEKESGGHPCGKTQNIRFVEMKKKCCLLLFGKVQRVPLNCVWLFSTVCYLCFQRALLALCPRREGGEMGERKKRFFSFASAFRSLHYALLIPASSPLPPLPCVFILKLAGGVKKGFYILRFQFCSVMFYRRLFPKLFLDIPGNFCCSSLLLLKACDRSNIQVQQGMRSLI